MTVDEPEDDADDPLKTVPLTRYNAMLAVVRNTLYMYVFLNSPEYATSLTFSATAGYSRPLHLPASTPLTTL